MRYDRVRRIWAVALQSAWTAFWEREILLVNSTGILFFLLLLAGVPVRTDLEGVNAVRIFGLTLFLLAVAVLFSTLRWNRAFQDPVMLLLIGSGLSRRGFLIGEFAGCTLAYGLSVAIHFTACGALLWLKGGEVHASSIVGGILMLIWWFMVIHAWGMMATIFIRDLLARLVIMAAFCLIVGLSFGRMDRAARPLLDLIALFALPVERMGDLITAALLSKPLPPIPVVPLAVVPILLLLAGDSKFRSRDLQVNE